MIGHRQSTDRDDHAVELFVSSVLTGIGKRTVSVVERRARRLASLNGRENRLAVVIPSGAQDAAEGFLLKNAASPEDDHGNLRKVRWCKAHPATS